MLISNKVESEKGMLKKKERKKEKCYYKEEVS